MAPFKWSLIMCLGGILLLGLPLAVESEAPAEETKPSSVKECRVHIEKALEQYWDHKEPGSDGSSVDQAGRVKRNPNLEEEEDQSLLNNKETLNENYQNIKNPDEIAQKDSEAINDQEDDDDEDEDEEDEEDEIEENDQNEENSNQEISEAGKNDSKNSEPVVDQEEEEDEEDEDEEEEEEEQDEDEEDTSENSENIGNELEDEDEDEDEDDEEEDDEDDEEEISNETAGAAEETEQTSSNIEESQKTEGEEQKKEESVSEETSKTETIYHKQTESEKVIGESDRASAGVASELPKEQPPPEQPKTPQAAEETLNVTVPEKRDALDTERKETLDKVESVPEQYDEHEEKDDDTIENIYEEEDEDESLSTLTFRSRDHIDVILGLDEIGTEYDKEEEKLAQSIFKEIKKIEATSIKPIEMLYKYTDSTSRVLGDAEIFNKPMILFLGPWSGGKTTIINYLLGLERTPAALKTGTGVTDIDFTLVTYGDQRQTFSGTELVADWRYAGLQKFGQGFLDHFRSIHIPHTLLKRVTIVDTPGILENRKNTERGYSFNNAFQWFIDRADAIYVVLDPTKVDIGGELGSVLDQLKGREVRFILNKADTIRRSDLMRVVGQLFWNLSPLMSSTEAPVIYAVSLTTKPYHPSAPIKFLADQEKNFLYDMKDTLDKRVEHRILYARRHAVRVRNHAQMVDCYLASYYRHKSIFSSKKNVAKQITENPRDYNIFEGVGSMSNVSRFDIPDPTTYKEFFKLHPLYDFKPLASTCSYFRGCPMDKLDNAIAKEIPELFAKYKKAKSGSSEPLKQEGR